MKKNIALFFGSFNPPTIQHIQIAEIISKLDYIDELFIVVTPHNPDKDVSTIADEIHRLNMVKLSIKEKDIKKAIASDVEFDIEKPNYTYKTIEKVKQLYPNDNIFFVCGADVFNDMNNWENFHFINQNCTFIALKRAGHEISEKRKKNSKHIELILPLEITELNISSTLVRNLVANQKDFSKFVPSTVENYIKENKLYKK